MTLSRCTFYGNIGNAIIIDSGTIELDRTIIAYCTEGVGIIGSANQIIASCSNVYGNAGGPGSFASLIGVNGNIAADPLFCDTLARNFTLREDSPCLPANNPSCGLIGAWPFGCIAADFSATPVLGPVPLDVQFTDLTLGNPDAWEWDFQNDGVADATAQNPSHQFATPGSYSVGLRAFVGSGLAAQVVRPQYVHALAADNAILHPTQILSSNPVAMPVEVMGRPFGAISIYLDYDATRLAYAGVQSLVSGETFSGGVVGNKISIQWFDETGGFDPIDPDADGDTLFAVLFTNLVQSGSARVTFDRALSVLADVNGDEISGASWLDVQPFGTVTIDIGAVVSGEVDYYAGGSAVPGVVLTLDPPHLEQVSDGSGLYAFPRQPYGNYVLRGAKTTDLGGINSLDAVKIIRHSTGAEPFGSAHQLRSANVDLNGSVNSLDALRVVRAAVELATLPSGNWVFYPDSVTLAPLDHDVAQTFQAIRMGDVNGSWAPDLPAPAMAGEAPILTDGHSVTAGAGRSPARVSAPSADLAVIGLSLPDTVIAAETPSLEVSLMVSNLNAVGAISLRVLHDPTVLQYQGVSSRVPGMSFFANRIGNEIRIEWYDVTGVNPMSIGSDTLLVITFDPIGQAGQTSPLDFLSTCAIGDAGGDPIPGVAFVNGSCILSGPLDVAAGPTGQRGLVFYGASPNPSASATTFLYRLSDPAPVELAVFDLTGRRVATLVDGRFEAGLHAVRWDGREQGGSNAHAGVYFARLRALGDLRTVKMIVLSP